MAGISDAQIAEFLQSPNNRCFVCGPCNPHGLHVHLRREGCKVVTEFMPTEWHGGWTRVVHGGILSALLDEVMAYTLLFDGLEAVTARMNLRFRASAHQGEQLRVEARITDRKRTIADVAGKIMRDGEVIVEGTGRFIIRGPLQPAML